MTLEEVLDLMDHEVWVRVRPHVRGPADEAVLPDLVLWSTDWIGGGKDDPGMPDGLKAMLDWGADDLSIERHIDPDRPNAVPMIVVNAYQYGT